MIIMELLPLHLKDRIGTNIRRINYHGVIPSLDHIASTPLVSQ